MVTDPWCYNKQYIPENRIAMHFVIGHLYDIGSHLSQNKKNSMHETLLLGLGWIIDKRLLNKSCQIKNSGNSQACVSIIGSKWVSVHERVELMKHVMYHFSQYIQIHLTLCWDLVKCMLKHKTIHRRFSFYSRSYMLKYFNAKRCYPSKLVLYATHI